MSLEILIVDDSEDTSRMMKVLLRKEGHKVQTANSVGTAISALAGYQFDMLISDLSLPDGNGKDLIRKLRKDSNPILSIAATGYCTPEDVEQCRQAGFDAHIAKPFDFESLIETINSLGAAKV